MQNDIRDKSRAAYIQCNGDRDEAIEKVRQEVEKDYGSIVVTILMGVLIQLAIDYIVYWVQNMVKTPALNQSLGEPNLPETLR